MITTATPTKEIQYASSNTARASNKKTIPSSKKQ